MILDVTINGEPARIEISDSEVSYLVQHILSHRPSFYGRSIDERLGYDN
jgi:hypothetical protein